LVPIQLIFNGVCDAAIYFLIGLSFIIIYRAAKFFDFSHAIVLTSGPYFCYALKNIIPWSLWVLVPLAMGLSGCLGCLLSMTIYGPARRQGASPLVLLLNSLGVYIVIQNVISLFLGDQPLSIRAMGPRSALALGGNTIAVSQLLALAAALIVGMAFAVIISWTRSGKAWRAVVSDPELALMSGINRDRVISTSTIIASIMVGGTGILLAFDIDMVPTMGMSPFLMGIVAAIIGGSGRISGVAMGALFLGMAQNLSVWQISSHWRDPLAFVILLVFLLFKPQGFMGRKIRKATA